MSNTKILPNEVYVVEFGAIIRTTCPHDMITNEMIHQRVVAANLAAGDVIRVQAMNHERTAVLHYAEFMVFDRRSEMKRVEVNDRETRNFEDVSFSILQTSPWAATPAAPVVKSDASAPSDAKIEWNPGKKAFEVKASDGSVIKAFTNDEGGKAAAEAFLYGAKAA